MESIGYYAHHLVRKEIHTLYQQTVFMSFIGLQIGPESVSRYSDSLRDPILVGEGERFSVPVQTGTGARLASYTVVFPGGKTAGTWLWPPTLSNAEVKEGV